MIRFFKPIESNDHDYGQTYDGCYPYVHWIEGQLSVGLWYTLKLTFISDQQNLQTSTLDDDSIFKFVDTTGVSPDTPVDLSTITKTQITSVGTQGTGEFSGFYFHQILLVCVSDIPGEYIDGFELDGKRIVIGADIYEENEILSINLENHGTSIPSSIQKAFIDNDIREDLTDYALVNRKFKELISNYIDILDNKGSYKSLYNALKWFEWGENTKLYEIWESDGRLLEKELSLMLSDKFSELLYTHRKTTHLALVSALQQPTDVLDEEKNPVVADIKHKWTNDELALKVSILGAFYERYFMPIHLDLKRASVEALVYTTQVKVKSGCATDQYGYFEDAGVVDIQMPNTIILESQLDVAVGENTMFARRVDDSLYPGNIQYIDPIGVDLLEDVGLNSDDTYSDDADDIATTWTQLKRGVGAVCHVKVSIDLPAGDGIKTEVLTVYDGWDAEGHPIKKANTPITEHRLFMSSDGKASFSFNLLSTKEEKVSFTLFLVTLSGHTWNASAGYECVDLSGSRLKIYQVTNDSSKYPTDIFDWAGPEHPTFDTLHYVGQPGPDSSDIDSSDEYSDIDEPLHMFTQYIPFVDGGESQFNQLILVENAEDTQGQHDYNIDWESGIETNWYIMHRNGDGSVGHSQYTYLISKNPGSQNTPNEVIGTILRKDLVYIPQLHTFTPINNYEFEQTELLCVIPEIKTSTKLSEILERAYWVYTNKTTLESIEIHDPMMTPLVADLVNKALSPGYWTIEFRFKLHGDTQEHSIVRNSAFKIKG